MSAANVYAQTQTNNFVSTDSPDTTISAIVPEADNTTSTFAMGQNEADDKLVRITINDDGSLNYSGRITSGLADRINQLGYGTFLNPISADVLQKKIFDILQSYNAPGLGNVTIVRPEYVSGIFRQDQAPAYRSGTYSPIILVASNVNVATQEAKFTAYSYNSNTGSYDLTPASQSSLGSISTATFTGFSALPS